MPHSLLLQQLVHLLANGQLAQQYRLRLAAKVMCHTTEQSSAAPIWLAVLWNLPNQTVFEHLQSHRHIVTYQR